MQFSTLQRVASTSDFHRSARALSNETFRITISSFSRTLPLLKQCTYIPPRPTRALAMSARRRHSLPIPSPPEGRSPFCDPPHRKASRSSGSRSPCAKAEEPDSLNSCRKRSLIRIRRCCSSGFSPLTSPSRLVSKSSKSNTATVGTAFSAFGALVQMQAKIANTAARPPCDAVKKRKKTPYTLPISVESLGCAHCAID